MKRFTLFVLVVSFAFLLGCEEKTGSSASKTGGTQPAATEPMATKPATSGQEKKEAAKPLRVFVWGNTDWPSIFKNMPENARPDPQKAWDDISSIHAADYLTELTKGAEVQIVLNTEDWDVRRENGKWLYESPRSGIIHSASIIPILGGSQKVRFCPSLRGAADAGEAIWFKVPCESEDAVKAMYSRQRVILHWLVDEVEIEQGFNVKFFGKPIEPKFVTPVDLKDPEEPDQKDRRVRTE